MPLPRDEFLRRVRDEFDQRMEEVEAEREEMKARIRAFDEARKTDPTLPTRNLIRAMGWDQKTHPSSRQLDSADLDLEK